MCNEEFECPQIISFGEFRRVRCFARGSHRVNRSAGGCDHMQVVTVNVRQATSSAAVKENLCLGLVLETMLLSQSTMDGQVGAK